MWGWTNYPYQKVNLADIATWHVNVEDPLGFSHPQIRPFWLNRKGKAAAELDRFLLRSTVWHCSMTGSTQLIYASERGCQFPFTLLKHKKWRKNFSNKDLMRELEGKGIIQLALSKGSMKTMAVLSFFNSGYLWKMET